MFIHTNNIALGDFMVKKSRGKMTTRSRTLKTRARSQKGPQQTIKEFKEGDIVALHFDTAQDKIMHPRFKGKTGKVIEKRGRSYVVELNDGNAKKKIIALPVHLYKIGE